MHVLDEKILSMAHCFGFFFLFEIITYLPGMFFWQRYIDRGVRTYTWAPVNGTDYRLGHFSGV